MAKEGSLEGIVVGHLLLDLYHLENFGQLGLLFLQRINSLLQLFNGDQRLGVSDTGLPSIA